MSDEAYVLQHIISNFIPNFLIPIIAGLWLLGFLTRFMRNGMEL